jgi:hypothetical protein
MSDYDQMSGIELKTLNNEQLVDWFRNRALYKVIALLDSDIPNVTKLYWEMEAIEDELRSRGMTARKALIRLMDDENIRVRYEAARRLLAVAPEKALQTIKHITATHKMPEAGEAGMTLSNLEKGIFKPS